MSVQSIVVIVACGIDHNGMHRRDYNGINAWEKIDIDIDIDNDIDIDIDIVEPAVQCFSLFFLFSFFFCTRGKR